MPEEYMAYLLSEEFGWTPEYIENMTAEWYDIYTGILREKAKAGKLKEQQGGFYR